MGPDENKPRKTNTTDARHGGCPDNKDHPGRVANNSRELKAKRTSLSDMMQQRFQKQSPDALARDRAWGFIMQSNNITVPSSAQGGTAYQKVEVFATMDRLVLAGVNWQEPEEIARFQQLAEAGLISNADIPTHMNRVLSASNAADLALQWLELRYPPGDLIEFRAIDPDHQGNGENKHFCLNDPFQRAGAIAFIVRHNGLRNIYMGLNGRDPEKAGDGKNGASTDVAVQVRRQVLLDLDNKDAPGGDWTPHLLALVPLGATAILSSGNGYHVYFDIEELRSDALNASVLPLRVMMARVGADNMADLARIGRIPFTCNIPGKSKRGRGAVLRAAVPVSFEGITIEPKTYAFEDLCAALKAFADQAGLPGRKNAADAKATPAAGHGGDKVGWAAPSLAIFEMALNQLPNEPGGPFDNRHDWQGIAHALKGAAIQGGFETAAQELFIEWSHRNGGDPDEPGRFWDSCSHPHTGWGTVMRALERVNPAGHGTVKTAIAAHAFAQVAVENRTALAASTSAFDRITHIAPAAIPPRQWLYGRSVVAGFIHVLVAPGGAGKSSLMMAEAVAMASGRELLACETPVCALRVHIHNAEDDMTEMQRRLAATLKHFNLSAADLVGGLSMSSGRDMNIQLARMGRNGPEEVPGVADTLIDLLNTQGVDVFVLDPLGAVHGLPENDNTAMNMLAGILRRIARETDAAIVLIHHTSKAASTDMDAAGAGASRGASAIVDAARVVRQVVRLTTKEAASFGVPDRDRRSISRVENGKANLSPAADAVWSRLVSVGLRNGTPNYPAGDFIAVAERWTQPGAVSGTRADLKRVQDAITALPSPPRADARSNDWVGYVAALALGFDVGPPGMKTADRTSVQAGALARVNGMLSGWLAEGALARETVKDQHRKERVVIKVGMPAEMLAPEDEPVSENVAASGHEEGRAE